MARPSKGIERRAEILAAFERCVISKGFERTTLADVATETGLPRSLVRHFIGNREDMSKALIDRLLERAQHQIEILKPHENRDDLVDLLTNAVFDDPTTNLVIMELWHVALRDPKLRRNLAEVYGSFITRVGTMLGVDSENAGLRRAYPAVSLAFGAAFFRYLGLNPLEEDCIAEATRACLDGRFDFDPPKVGAT